MNVLPELLPRISRSELRDRIEQFVALAEQAEVRRRDFYRLTDWLSEHRPYLTRQDAARIEEARAVIEPKLEKADLWPVVREFQGNQYVPDELFLE